jgi:8-oxo-dGTP pyrophosphatase MutT (NUDIX family)
VAARDDRGRRQQEAEVTDRSEEHDPAPRRPDPQSRDPHRPDLHGRDLHGPDPHGPDPRDPWTTLASREVYANPWIRVREDQVLRPDGSPGIYGVVSTNLAVGVLAVTGDDRVVLVGQWRYTLDAYSWEIVEGGADPGEDSRAAAARELAEEAGLHATSWERLGPDLAISNSVTDEIAHLWLARDLRPVPRDPDPTEVLEVRHVTLDTALTMVDRGDITDVMSIAALLRFDRDRHGS